MITLFYIKSDQTQMFMQVILLKSFENFNSVVWNIFFILAEVWILVSWITVYLIHFL
jgi:hypothetical protein